LILSDEQQHHKKLDFTDAATVIYPGSKGDPWWNMEQICDQIAKKAIPIFEALHPDCQGVFVFDCSSAHKSFGPSALQVQNINLSSGGKQAQLRDTIIPMDDPLIPEHLRGQRQETCYPANYQIPQLAGQPKGVQQVLIKRGLWQYYTAAQVKSGLPIL
jgi:hypothetical protein